MNRLFVLKDVPYASKVGGGTIASIKEVGELAPGALAVFTDRGALLDVASAGALATATDDVKTLQMAVGREEDTQVIQVPRVIPNITVNNYKPLVKGKLRFEIPANIANGEGTLLILDNTFTSRYATRRKDVTLIKKATQTVEQYVDALIAEVNKSDWLSAAKVVITAGTQFAIEITVSSSNVSDLRTTLTGAKDGVLSETVILENVDFAYGQGLGYDVLQLEKDFSSEEGNHGYIELTQDFYSRPYEASISSNYDVINILWEGTHSSPTRSHNVMRNRLVLSCVNGATDQTADSLQTFLRVGLSNIVNVETGRDTGEGDGSQDPIV